MGGFLVPEWYVAHESSPLDTNFASIIWGLSLSCAVFTFAKGSRQSWSSVRRTRDLNVYIVMVWLEWTASVVFSILSWLFLQGSIQPSFWFFFCLLSCWVIQIQCALQIIINRIALLMIQKEKVVRMKWIVGLVIGAINISVFCIWIPARLQINETYIHVNEVWDRAEKAIFAIIDVGLNLYFIYLVKEKLISNGLSKYNRLFQFNLLMIVISLSLDIVLIGVMSLPNGAVYLQFHPLVYLIKLHIEMNMAELIAKIVRSSNPHPSGSNGESRSNGNRGGSHKMTTIITARKHRHSHAAAGQEVVEYDAGVEKGGIQRTIETQVKREPKVDEDDDMSESSSTRKLHQHFAIV